MRAYFDEFGHPRIETSVKGSRADALVQAVVDTGFDGEICLPTSLAIQLGLELRHVLSVELADGTIQEKLVFAGTVVWEEEDRDMMILLTEAEDTLLGIGLLQGSVLEMNFPQREIKVSAWIED